MTNQLILKRIEDKLIVRGGCLVFKGAHNKTGYGIILSSGKNTFTHRIVASHFLPDYSEELVVRHTCDVPACCNPQHLLMGTQADNLQDARDRGRARSDNQWGLLSDEEREDIRGFRALGLTMEAIAALTGTAKTTVHRVLTSESR